MIISKNVEMKLGIRNFKRLKNKYNFNDSLNPGDIALIPIELLSKSSHLEIEAECDYCGKKLIVMYKNYIRYTSVVNKCACSSKECSNQKIKDVCMMKYGVENPFQAEFVKEKSKDTLKEKFGVEHPMYLESTKDKIKETCLERYGETNFTKTEQYNIKSKETCMKKYGVDHSSKNADFQKNKKEVRIKNGTQLSDDMIEPYQLYRKNVDNITDRLKDQIYNNWDGYDYYDGEYIKENLNLNPNDRNRPTIDHKISVYYGFKNGIPFDEISNINNICITKSYLNSKKRDMNEDDFIKRYNIKKED